MKTLTTFTFAVACLSLCSGAIQLQRRKDGPPRVVRLPIERELPGNGISESQIRRRDKTAQVTTDNFMTRYYVNVTLGTPPQKMRLLLDTSVSDTWVNVANSSVCLAAPFAPEVPCSTYGTYDANASSTYNYAGLGFNLTRSLVGLEEVGDYATDTLTFGSTTFEHFQFGIAYSSTDLQGELGIGHPLGESQVINNDMATYNNLPMQMVAQGLINSNAYSLWLNDLNSSSGNILFGGVDTARYHGSLATLPLQKIQGSVTQFPVTLTGMTYNSVVIGKNMALAIALVSGDTISYLPDALAQAVMQEVGAYFDPVSGSAFIPCSQSTVQGVFNFTFSGVTISIPMSEMVLNNLDNDDGGIPQTIGGQGVEACIFGIAPALDTPIQLGDTFLRSAYVVFDIDNSEVSMAQTNFKPNGSDVVEIGTGAGAVPDATPVPNAVVATQGTTGFGLDIPSPTASSGLGGNTTTSGVECNGCTNGLRVMMLLGLMLSVSSWF